MELWKEEQNYSILFKQFPPDNEQFHPPPKNIPRFPGERWRQLSPVCMRAPVRIVASAAAYSRFSRRSSGHIYNIGCTNETRREELTQRRVENDERTNERTKLEGRGKEGNAELERKRSLYEQLEKENTRNGEETEERGREEGWEGCGCRDVSVGTAGCEGRNRSPAGSQGLSKVG